MNYYFNIDHYKEEIKFSYCYTVQSISESLQDQELSIQGRTFIIVCTIKMITSTDVLTLTVFSPGFQPAGQTSY